MEKKGTVREKFYIDKALKYINTNYKKPITVADIAKHTGISRSYLYSIFVNILGTPPCKYLMRFRIEKATELLKTTNRPIKIISSSCGYVNPLVFTKAFNKIMGMSPTSYRKQAVS